MDFGKSENHLGQGSDGSKRMMSTDLSGWRNATRRHLTEGRMSECCKVVFSDSENWAETAPWSLLPGVLKSS